MQRCHDIHVCGTTDRHSINSGMLHILHHISTFHATIKRDIVSSKGTDSSTKMLFCQRRYQFLTVSTIPFNTVEQCSVWILLVRQNTQCARNILIGMYVCPVTHLYAMQLGIQNIHVYALSVESLLLTQNA